jgi:hypothetical protein
VTFAACSASNIDLGSSDATPSQTAAEQLTDDPKAPTEATADPATEPQPGDWRQLYTDLVRRSEFYSDFALINVNADNVPELIYIDNVIGSRIFAMICDDDSPQVVETAICECGNFPSDDVFLYQEQGASFYYCAYVNKSATEKVFLLNDEPTVIFEGSYADGFDFKVNGKPMPEPTYKTMLKRSFDFDTAKRVTEYKTKDEIISEIENYSE